MLERGRGGVQAGRVSRQPGATGGTANIGMVVDAATMQPSGGRPH